MEISKTKRKFIDTARQLFAKQGFESTTMNDIAEASEKGRRTLYIYFKNKNDVFQAVIQHELEMLYVKLEGVVKKQISADQKLMLFLFTRLNAIRDVVQRNGNLRADFFRNIWLVENVRKEFDQKEIAFLIQILKEGVESAIFKVEDLARTSKLLHYSMKGLEVPVIRGALRLNIMNTADRETIEILIFKGLKR